MKKIEYQAPEMEVVELKNQGTLLSTSDPSESFNPSDAQEGQGGMTY